MTWYEIVVALVVLWVGLALVVGLFVARAFGRLQGDPAEHYLAGREQL
jgi:hypothetical protein